MRIESLRADRKNAKLVVISLEDGSRMRTSAEEVVRLGLRAGDQLDDETIDILAASRKQLNVRRMAINVLSNRSYSKKGLEKRLLEKGAEPEQASEAAAWLEEVGVIDDEKYARGVADSYTRRGMGANRVKQELARRGIARELSEEIVEALNPDDAVDHFIESKLKGKLPDRDDTNRLIGALARRGHDYEDISRAIRRYISEHEEDI